MPSFAKLVPCLILMGGAALVSPTRAADVPDAPAIYDRTAGIVTDNFYDRSFRGLPWKSLVADYRRRLDGPVDEEQLKDTINGLLGNLHASHTEFLSEADQEYWGIRSIFSRQIDGAPFPGVGAWFTRIDGHWFIRNLFVDAPAEKAGLRTGDEIVAVDGKPFQPVRSFAGPGGRPVLISYRRSRGGPVRDADVVPEEKAAQRLLLDSSIATKRVFREGGRRLGYFRLWSGTHPRFKQALADAAGEFSGTTDGMILDLRDGFGGSGGDYLDPFFDHDEDGRPIGQVYAKPMVALINGGTRSGKEGVAFILEHSRRATLVGSRTAGYFLGGRPFVIKPDRFLLFLAVDGNGPPGVDLEGKGLPPDVAIPFDLPYSAGRDPQLDAAIAWLAQRLHTS